MKSVQELQDALNRFHCYHVIFKTTGVCELQSPMATFALTLHQTHLCLWCAKWPLLFNNGVKTYQENQQSLYMIKSL